MSELHSLKRRMDAKPRNPQPPLYLTELPISKRNSKTDGKAIKLVTLAVKAINELRIRNRTDNEDHHVTQGSHPTDPDGLGLDSRKGYSCEYGDSSGANQLKQDRRDTKHAKYTTSESKTDMYSGNPGGNNHDEDSSSSAWEPPIDGPDVMIPLRSMYKGQWPIKNHPVRGAKQYSWSNVGFPRDSSLDLPDFEDETIIDTEENAVTELSQDITDIKTKSASKIADKDSLETHEEYGCAIETFKLHGRFVVKIKIYDADLGAKRPFYSGCQVAREFERKVDACMRPQPALEVEQWVAAQFLLAQGGQIGGRTQDYWRRARDMAQQQLYVNLSLEEAVLQRIHGRTSVSVSEDPALEQMLELVKKGISRKSFNPYYQAQRDELAVEKGLFHQVDAEIVLVLDKADNVIAFQCKDAFRELLCKNVEHKVAASLEAFSTRQPVPFPDMTRHGLHWIDWLRERPELDFRRPENDCRLAKSGVYHFGVRCRVGDPNGKLDPSLTKDSSRRLYEDDALPFRQMSKLLYSVFGACTEIVRHFFRLLDSELLDQYIQVASEVGKDDILTFKTRRENEPFMLRAALINLMTHEHRDSSDWHRGFAGLVAVGEFEGGDLLLRELGLRIACYPGSVQLIRGRELRHSITKWTGRRFVLVHATHEAVQRWALRERGDVAPQSTNTSLDSCLNAEQEDVVPEDQRCLSERDMFPETWEPDSDDSDSSSEVESEASIHQHSGISADRPKRGRQTTNNSSDASAEKSDGDCEDGGISCKKGKKAVGKKT